MGQFMGGLAAATAARDAKLGITNDNTVKQGLQSRQNAVNQARRFKVIYRNKASDPSITPQQKARYLQLADSMQSVLDSAMLEFNTYTQQIRSSGGPGASW